MISLARFTICICFLLSSALSLFGAELKLHGAHLSKKNRNTIYAQFETPNALQDCDVEFNTAKCKSVTTAPWTVVVYDTGGRPTTNVVTEAKDEVVHLQSNGVVTLMLTDPIPAPDKFSRIDVTYMGGTAPFTTIPSSAKPAKKLVAAAKTKDDADVYISGTFAPAAGSSPTYSIDTKGKYIIRSFGQSGSKTLSATGDVSTDSKKTADPDSFHWAIPIQYVSPGWYTLQWSTVGMELDKKANAINLVSSPTAIGSFSHLFTRRAPKGQTSEAVAAVGLDLTLGAEFGDNLRNDYAIVNSSSSGEGAFFRGLAGANAYLVIPRVWHLNKISLTSSYTARIPTSDELFLETRHQKDPLPLLTSKTRNYVENSLNFMFTDYVGIQIKHKYGSLPPGFKFIDNSGSIGLVFLLKQTSVPR